MTKYNEVGGVDEYQNPYYREYDNTYDANLCKKIVNIKCFALKICHEIQWDFFSSIDA